MRIVVCMKAVPASTEVKMDPVTNTIIRDGGEAVANPFDTAALELALAVRDRMRGRGDSCRVDVISMGIPATEKILRDAVARGADGAALLTDRAFAGADTRATTYALACGIRKLGGADAVFCGKMAVDGDTAQIGPELAGAFGMACLADVREVLAFEPHVVRARCGSDLGVQVLESSCPVVLTVAKEAAQLRMPSIPGVLAAEGAPVALWSAADADADPARTGLAGSPTQVVRSFVPPRAADAEDVAGSAGEQAARIIEIWKGGA